MLAMDITLELFRMFGEIFHFLKKLISLFQKTQLLGHTVIVHKLLKSRKTAHNFFKTRDGSTCHTHREVGQGMGCFINSINGGGENMCTVDQKCRMIDFLVDDIFVKFGCLFCQVIGILTGRNCAPLLADLFLYTYERDFLDTLVRSDHMRLARTYIFVKAI